MSKKKAGERQALEEIEAVADAALEWHQDDPEKYEKALKMIRSVTKKALAAAPEPHRRATRLEIERKGRQE
jgi:hypothetical protein